MLWEMGSMTDNYDSNGYFPVKFDLLFREVGTRAAAKQPGS